MTQTCKIDSAERDMLVCWFMAVSTQRGTDSDALMQLKRTKQNREKNEAENGLTRRQKHTFFSVDKVQQ